MTHKLIQIDSYWEYVADRWENGGLIIKKALYGDLSDPSKAIDVTVALQVFTNILHRK